MQDRYQKDIVKYLMRIANALEKIEKHMQQKYSKVNQKTIKGLCKGCKKFNNCNNKINMGDDYDDIWFPKLDAECNRGE